MKKMLLIMLPVAVLLSGCANMTPIPEAPAGSNAANFERDWLACGGRDYQEYTWLGVLVGLPGTIASEVIHDRSVQSCMERRGWPPRPLQAAPPDPALIDRAHGR